MKVKTSIVIGGTGPKTPPIVHALFGELPLCGFSTEKREFWPDGHKWTYVYDTQNMTCLACKTEALKPREEKP